MTEQTAPTIEAMEHVRASYARNEKARASC